MRKDFSGIYLITDTANGRKYVGQSGNVYRRRKQHFSALRAGKHENWQMQFDYNMDKRHFKWEVLEWCDTKLLNEREKYWIDQLGTMSPHGYNMGWQPYRRRVHETEKQFAIRKIVSENSKKLSGSGVKHKKTRGHKTVLHKKKGII